MGSAKAASSNTAGPNAIPVFERQIITSQILRELRVACALVVKDTGPSGAEMEAILNQPDPLDTYNKEVATVRAKASHTQASTFPTKGLRHKDRASKSNLASVNQSSTTLPLSRPRSNVYTSNHRSASALPQCKPRFEPVPPMQPGSADKPIARRSVPARDEEALARIRLSMSLRPKTSAAASVDYVTATVGSSGSTTRSNTTLEPRASTNLTSYNQTPADDKRGSYQFPKRASSRTASARAWRPEDASSQHEPERDLSLPNPDYLVPSLQHARTAPLEPMVSREPSRPRSRASSIKSSIWGGIRDYMQPKPSLEALSRSASETRYRAESRSSSRPPSRGSNFSQSSRGWLKGAASGLRRKGSYSSRKGSRPGEGDRGRAKGKGPDLNRSLPPLPGLDSYKEPKRHIAQMMTVSSPPPPPPPPSQTQTAASHKPSKVGGLTNPMSPNSQASVASSATNPQNCNHPFPRIPFSDNYRADLANSRVTSPAQPIQSPRERQVRESERRRQRQERSKETQSKDADDADFEKKREEEIRRVVRERIMRGGLTKEAFNADERDDQPQSPLVHPASPSRLAAVQRRAPESEKKRGRHKKLETEATLQSDETPKPLRTSGAKEKSQDVTPRKQSLKSRLSKLLKNDSNLSQGHGSAIIAN